jgi:hypothetical protein
MSIDEHLYQKLTIKLGFKSKTTGKFKYRSKSFRDVKRSDYCTLRDYFIAECKAPRNHYLKTNSGTLIY